MIRSKLSAVLIALSGIFIACQEQDSLKERLDGELLGYAEVGAAAMPDSIAPINSPLFQYDFKRPEFPETVDTLFSNSETTIQEAIDHLDEKGGGTLVLAEGIYETGRITLRSNINLHLQKEATIQFRDDIEDFLPVVFTRNEGVELYSLGACIYARDEENIAITGSGNIIGPGKGSVRERTMTHDVIENIVDHNLPVEQRVYDGKTAEFIFPPALIAPINCENVFIEGLHLSQSAFWNVVPTYCENVIIRGLTIHSEGIPRGDGIDIESSKNVLVEYCTLNTGDDCIAIKAGRGYDGLRVAKPSENIVVRYSLAATGHGGITLGSETAGMIKNLHVYDCVFDGTDVGIRFKTRRPRGGGGEHILMERIRMHVVHSALRWDMLGNAIHVGEAADRNTEVEVNALTPKFSDISMKKILIEESGHTINIEGIPESPLENVVLSEVYGVGKNFLTAKDVTSFLILDSEFISENTEVDSVNATGLVLDNVAVLEL